MAILILFLLGVANFAMHKAVLESGHPLLGQMPWFFHMLNGRFGLLVDHMSCALEPPVAFGSSFLLPKNHISTVVPQPVP